MKAHRYANVWTQLASGLLALLAFSGCLVQAHGEQVRPPEIVIPVTVTDRLGRAITGLDPSRFRARIDGHHAEITAVEVSKSLATAIVFSPNEARRWAETRERIVGSLSEGAPGEPLFLALSHEEDARERASGQGVQLIEPRTGRGSHGRQLSEMISSGLDAMVRLPERAERRRAIFVILSSPPDTFRRYRRRLARTFAGSGVQLYALWRSRREYAENEGRSMRALEDLVARTGGRSAEFHDPREIPGIVTQFATALRHTYVLRILVPSRGRTRERHKIEVDVLLPSGDPPVLVSFPRRAVSPANIPTPPL